MYIFYKVNKFKNEISYWLKRVTILKNKFYAIQIILYLSLVASIIYSQENEIKTFMQYDLRAIKEINIIGLDYTNKEEIYAFLRIKKGDIFKSVKLSNDLQRLRNTGLFAKVRAECKTEGKNNLIINIYIKDKWTLLPIIGFNTQKMIIMLWVYMMQISWEECLRLVVHTLVIKDRIFINFGILIHVF